MKFTPAFKHIIASFIAILISVSPIFADTYKATISADANWDTLSIWTKKVESSYEAATIIPPIGSAIEYAGTADKILTFNLNTASGTYKDYTIASFATTNDVNSIVAFNSNLTITGNLTAQNKNARTFRIKGTGELNIGGSVIYTGDANNSISFGYGENTVNKVVVEGDAIIKFATLRFASTNLVQIKGLLDMQVKTDGSSARNILLAAGADRTTSCVRFGALQGDQGSTSDGAGGVYVNNVKVSTRTAYMTFTGISDKTYSYYGDVKNSVASVDDRLHVIMQAANAGFTQVLGGTNNFTGDTILTQGNLKVNVTGGTLGTVFLGYEAERAMDSDAIASIVDKDNAQTSLIFSGAGGSLTILNWHAGTLGFELSDAAKTSAIISMESLRLNPALQEYVFDFTNAESGQTYALIYIEGSSIDASALDKFIAMENGRVINGKFTLVLDDPSDLEYSGRTLYFAIPEPGTYAIVLGALALVIVVYRRRK